MEKIKNLIKPGSKQDDEVMYGSGLNTDPVHDNTIVGQGSHSGSSRGVGNDPTSTSEHGSGIAGTGHHSAVNEKPFSTHGLGTTEPNVPSSTSGTTGTFDDAASTASIKSGVPGNAPSGSLTGLSGPHDTLNTNKPLPHEPTSTGTSGTSGVPTSAHPTSGHTTSGPHSSDLANRADPRVDSDLDGSRGLGGNTTGSGSGLAGGSLPDRSLGRSGLGNEPQTADSSHLGRDVALGAGAVGAGAAAHHHHDRDRENLGTDSGRIFPLGGHSGAASSSEYPSGTTGVTGSSTAGPHSSNLANKADPRVDSDLDGSRTAGNVGHGVAPGNYGSSTGLTAGSGHQGSLERGGGLGNLTGATGVGTGTAGHGPESWKHDHAAHGHEFGGDPCDHGASAVGGPHFTTGPHVTDTANRLDPHVASGISEPSTTTHDGSGSGLGSTIHPGNHHGRDAALAAGVGAAGAGAYESSRDPSGTNPESSSTTTGPHKSGLLNKLDPRVHADPSTQQSSTGTTGPTEISTTGTSDFPSSSTAGKEHHHGRDAGLAGAGGVAGYEAEKHLHHDRPAGTTSTGIPEPYSKSAIDPRVDSTPSSGLTGSTHPTALGKDHHPGHDAGLLGSTGAPSYDHNRGPVGNEGDLQPGSAHHHGRDAGLAGLGAGGVAAYEADKHHGHKGPTDPIGSSTHPSSGYDARDRTAVPHTGRDAALVGGAGAGVGAAAEAEFSKKEAEKLAKLREKDIEKEQKVIHKDQIKHEKSLEKEEKKHEKAVEKDEKKHEKALEKEEKKHEDGKKHGGILGLFHKDKHDKELKEEERERRGTSSHHGAETAAGVGAAGAVGAGVAEHEKHDRNRLHKDPPAGYGQHAGYGDAPSHGYASEVTGGTGTTALAQGQDLPGGSHLTQTGNKVDPNIPAPGSSLEGDRAIEPHTQLPIDLTKGTGAGGTDANPIPGYHQHGAAGATNPTISGYDNSTGATTGGYGNTGGITGTTGTSHHASGHTGTTTSGYDNSAGATTGGYGNTGGVSGTTDTSHHGSGHTGTGL